MKTGREALEKNVKDIIAGLRDISPESINGDSVLSVELGLDSFDAVELTYALKDRFGVEMPPEDMSGIKRVRDVVEYLLRAGL